jgi:hypothetical protein
VIKIPSGPSLDLWEVDLDLEDRPSLRRLACVPVPVRVRAACVLGSGNDAENSGLWVRVRATGQLRNLGSDGGK